MTRHALASRFDRLYPNVYIPTGQPLSATDRAMAAWLWSGRSGVLCGLSAAALHGALWIDGQLPAELVSRATRAPKRLLVHQDQLAIGEITMIGRVSVTTPARTAFDIGRRMRFTEALVYLDSLMRATGVEPAAVRAVIDQHCGARGVVQLRELLELADAGAESPQETRTRLALTRGGLPRPQTQIQVCDESGYVIARIDMGWDAWKVGVEFDGAQHWTDPKQRTRDIDRTAELERRRWRLIRVSSDMLRTRPTVIIDRVREALVAAGWRPYLAENALTPSECEKRPA